MPRTVVLLLLLAGCAAAPSRSALPPGGAAERHTMLAITKDENRNYVVYDLILDEDGGFAAEPIDAYWIMAETGGQRAELNGIEAGIYGVEVDDVDRDSRRLSFKIKAVDARPISVELAPDESEPEVSMTIDGRTASLEGVHLQIRKTWNPLRPDVKVELTGTRTEGQRELTLKETIEG